MHGGGWGRQTFPRGKSGVFGGHRASSWGFPGEEMMKKKMKLKQSGLQLNISQPRKSPSVGETTLA